MFIAFLMEKNQEDLIILMVLFLLIELLLIGKSAQVLVQIMMKTGSILKIINIKAYEDHIVFGE